MSRHSVRRTLCSLSLVVLLGAAPAAAQTGASRPALSVMDRLLSLAAETWTGLEGFAVQLFAQEKDGGEGTEVESPDGSTTTGTTDPDPNDPDNGAWIDPNG